MCSDNDYYSRQIQNPAPYKPKVYRNCATAVQSLKQKSATKQYETGNIYCNSNSDQKNPPPCQDLNSRPLWYQSNALPTELSKLDNLYQRLSVRTFIGLNCWMMLLKQRITVPGVLAAFEVLLRAG